MKQYYVYIMASKPYGTLYIGVTNNLRRRIIEHKNGFNKGFTNKYQVYRLVYFECFNYIEDAIKREKRLKKWNRQWKINLIKKKQATLERSFNLTTANRPSGSPPIYYQIIHVIPA